MRLALSFVVLLIASPLGAQELTSAELQRQVQSLLKRYALQIQAEAETLDRATEVLRLLTDAAQELASPQVDRAAAQAGRKLEEAMAVAEEEPPLDDAVHDVLQSTRRLLERRHIEPPEMARARFFAELDPLREYLLARTDNALVVRDLTEALSESARSISMPLYDEIKAALRELSRTHREQLRSR